MFFNLWGALGFVFGCLFFWIGLDWIGLSPAVGKRLWVGGGSGHFLDRI